METSMKKSIVDRLAQIENDIADIKILLLPIADRCPLTQTEVDIVDALGRDTLPGKAIAARAGYSYEAVRHHLSNLKKRGWIEHVHSEGYRRLDVSTL